LANNTTFTNLCSGWVRKKARKLLAEANVVYYNVKAKAAVIVEQKARKKVNPPPLKSAAENGDVEGSSDEKVNPPPLKTAAENVDVEGSSDEKVNPPPLKSAAENGDVDDEKGNPPPLKSAAENVDVEGSRDEKVNPPPPEISSREWEEGSSDEEHEDSALALLQDGNGREPLRMTTRQKEKEVLTEMGILLDEVTENDLQDTEHVLDKIRTGEMKDAFQVSPLYQQGAFG
jgi:hypothetical protein